MNAELGCMKTTDQEPILLALGKFYRPVRSLRRLRELSISAKNTESLLRKWIVTIWQHLTSGLCILPPDSAIFFSGRPFDPTYRESGSHKSSGSLSKNDVDDKEYVIWKCNFSFLQSFLNCSKSLYFQNVLYVSWDLTRNSASGIRRQFENLWSSADVVHTTAKQVIARRRKDENSYGMYKNGKRTCKACKTTVCYCLICKFLTFVVALAYKLPSVLEWRFCHRACMLRVPRNSLATLAES